MTDIHEIAETMRMINAENARKMNETVLEEVSQSMPVNPPAANTGD